MDSISHSLFDIGVLDSGTHSLAHANPACPGAANLGTIYQGIRSLGKP